MTRSKNGCRGSSKWKREVNKCNWKRNQYESLKLQMEEQSKSDYDEEKYEDTFSDAFWDDYFYDDYWYQRYLEEDELIRRQVEEELILNGIDYISYFYFFSKF
jgi:hypothetical protein